MKIFAYYLPQFHCIPENDEWWGKGFTEWTNVRKAQPLFPGHRQPRVPLNGNYYNLLEPETLDWQARIAKEHHIDGFIYYHYYFRGKKLLEKPAENLLARPEVPLSYFFCWANHDWNRAWEGKREILVKQEYGNQDDWEEHFRYLLPFFRDPRYEKRDNKPLLILFRTHFEEKEAMIRYFNRRCVESGFDGICIIETMLSGRGANRKQLEDESSPATEMFCVREPAVATDAYLHTIPGLFHGAGILAKRFINSRTQLKLLEKYNGNKLYHFMEKTSPRGEKYIPGIFFEWDNTPRHGKRGYLISPPDKAVFMRYMDTVRDKEYVFANAWNEWAEGMMLEPTEEDGYKYLDWIREWTEKERTAGR